MLCSEIANLSGLGVCIQPAPASSHFSNQPAPAIEPQSLGEYSSGRSIRFDPAAETQAEYFSGRGVHFEESSRAQSSVPAHAKLCNSSRKSSGSWTTSTPSVSVVLIGLGRYGGDLVGPKYVLKAFGPDVNLVAIVEPRPLQPHIAELFSSVPVFTSFKALVDSDLLSRVRRSSLYFDLALPPFVIPSIMEDVLQYTSADMFILPKPVATTREELDELARIGMQSKSVSVLSHWWYSDMPTRLRQEILKLHAKGYRLRNADFDYSKPDQNMTSYTPVFCCFPHQVHILDLLEIVDLSEGSMTRFGPTWVNMFYPPSRDGIDVWAEDAVGVVATSNVQDPTVPLHQKMNRVMNLHFNHVDRNRFAAIKADFGIMFENGGGRCWREGFISVAEEAKTSPVEASAHHVVATYAEDNLATGMTAFLKANMPKLPGEDSAPYLTLGDYLPIAEHLVDVEEAWEMQMKLAGLERLDIYRPKAS